MPKQPNPWYRPSRGVWYVQINRRQYNLGPDRDEAFRRFHLLMANPEPSQAVQSDSLAGVVDKFLDWTQRHRASRTFDWYQERLQSFFQFRTPEYRVADLTVDQLKPHHVQSWVDEKNCSPGHKGGCIRAVKRALNWARKFGYIDHNPIAFLEQPKGSKRDIVISRSLYEQIRRRASDQYFHDLVTLAWETGARPEELLALKGRHVDLQGERWLFHRQEAKGKRGARVVYLTDEALAVTGRLVLKYPDKTLLRNAKDEPWSAGNVDCRFKRLKKHIGLKVCLYTFRHTFATRLIEAGVDSLVVGALMGHADLSMLGRTYAHLTHNAEHLRQQLKRA